MPAFARRGDFWSGLALAALGAYILSEASGWTYKGEDGPGPGFFPMWYGGAMVILSLALVAGTVLKHPVGESRAPSWPELRRALTCWVAFVACVALMKLVGFMVAFALLTWFIVAIMAKQPQKVALPVAIGGAVLFYLLFDVALEVTLPTGLWF